MGQELHSIAVFSISSWLGSIPGWLTLVALAGASWLLYKGGAGQAVSILRESNTTLSKEVERLKTENSAQAKRIAILEAKTDVTLALRPIAESLQEVLLELRDRREKPE
jgi:threonine/homoserine/homoserine lactone efflux protein